MHGEQLLANFDYIMWYVSISVQTNARKAKQTKNRIDSDLANVWLKLQRV